MPVSVCEAAKHFGPPRSIRLPAGASNGEVSGSFVGEKVERDPLAPTYPGASVASNLSKVVIVGGGAAGTAAAEMLRRCGFRGDVTVVDEDAGSPYDRPNLSKDYLAGNAPEEWIPIRPAGFYDEHRNQRREGSRQRSSMSQDKRFTSTAARQLPTTRSFSPRVPSPSA